MSAASEDRDVLPELLDRVEADALAGDPVAQRVVREIEVDLDRMEARLGIVTAPLWETQR